VNFNLVWRSRRLSINTLGGDKIESIWLGGERAAPLLSTNNIKQFN